MRGLVKRGAVRPGEIRAALQRDKGVSLAYVDPPIRHALDSWKAAKRLGRMGMADGGSRRRQLPDDRGAPVLRELAEGGEARQADREEMSRPRNRRRSVGSIMTGFRGELGKR